MLSAHQFNSDRTQSNTWLWDEDTPALYKIAKRFDRLTGLQISDPDVKHIAGEPVIYQEPTLLKLFYPYLTVALPRSRLPFDAFLC